MNKTNLLALAVALCLVVALAGCATAPTSGSSAAAPAVTQTITGTVEDAGMSTLTLVDDSGNQYTLLREDAQVESANGLLIGDGVTVTYTGELQNGASATKIVVAEAAHTTISGVLVDVTDNSITVRLPNGNSYTMDRTGAQVTGGEPALGDAVEVAYTGELEGTPVAVTIAITAAVDGVITGTVTDATMNGINVKVASGNQYFFSKTEAIVEGIDGIKLGETVEIAYAGHLEDTPSAVVIDVLTEPVPTPEASESSAASSSSSAASSSSSAAPSSAAPSSAPAAPAQPQIKTVSGKITDVTSNTFSIYSKGGNNYTFSRKGAAIVGEDGLTVGDSVDINYTGVASRSPVAVKVTVTATAADTVSTFTGTIDDATNTKLMLANRRGDIYTFYGLQYADVWHDADVYIGDKVAIKYTGTIGRGPEVTFIRVLESNSGDVHGSDRVSSISGTVDDATSSSVSVTDSRGNSYLFTRDGAEITGGSLLIGDTVTISYTGTIGQNPRAVRIVITRSAPVPEGGTMTGTVTDASMSTFILSDANGNSFNFSRENATVSGGSLAVGVSASVTYTGELGEGPQATYIQILG